MAVCLFLANNCDGSLALKLKSKLKGTREEENYERIGKESEANQGPKMNLPICYKLFIAPVACFLERSSRLFKLWNFAFQ